MGRYLIIAIVVLAAAAFGPDLARDILDDGRLLAAARVDDGDSNASQASSGLRTLVLKAGHNGHFQVSAHFNGRPVQSLIDTGASAVALPHDVARRAGVAPGHPTIRFASGPPTAWRLQLPCDCARCALAASA